MSGGGRLISVFQQEAYLSIISNPYIREAFTNFGYRIINYELRPAGIANPLFLW